MGAATAATAEEFAKSRVYARANLGGCAASVTGNDGGESG